MEIIKFTRNSKDKKILKKIFIEAFPKAERPPYYYMVKRASRENVDYLAFYDNDNLVGLSYSIINGDVVYFFYFAIKKEFRGKGYGSEALNLILERYKGKRLFLAIEQMDKSAQNYPQRLKRHSFYEKSGLKDLPCSITEVSLTYDVMGTDYVTSKDYEKLMTNFMGKFLKKFTTMKLTENGV